MTGRTKPGTWLALLALLAAAGCSGHRNRDTFHDAEMDFGQVRRVAVLPFTNLTPVSQAAGRVSEVFNTLLQASGSIYVLPPGEVRSLISRTKLERPEAPTADEVVALAKAANVDAVITGSVLEYGEVRSGAAAGNVITVSVRMMEAQTGKVVWTSSSSKGGVNLGARLLGGGGAAMDEVTQRAVDDLLDKLFEK